MRKPVILTALLWPMLLPAVPPAAAAGECAAQSGDRLVPLIELYTSEGCSSCPPADDWLSGIAAQGFTEWQVVALAFHVDYWDDLGWKDRFADPLYTARQRQAASAGRAPFVYTPQVLFNGADFRSWQNRAQFARAIDAGRKQPAAANLRLALTPQASGEIAVNATADGIAGEARKNAEMFVAVYENGLKSAVAAGENSGRELSHNYVVRKLLGPYPLDGQQAPWRQSFTLEPEWRSRDAGVASFVQERAGGRVLQSLALKICAFETVPESSPHSNEKDKPR